MFVYMLRFEFSVFLMTSLRLGLGKMKKKNQNTWLGLGKHYVLFTTITDGDGLTSCFAAAKTAGNVSRSPEQTLGFVAIKRLDMVLRSCE